MLAKIVDFTRDMGKIGWGVMAGLSVLLPFVPILVRWWEGQAARLPDPRRLLAVVPILFVIIFCYRRREAIWESKKLRELRGYGPDPSNYAIAALIAGFVLFMLDLAGLPEYLRDLKVATQIERFTIYIFHSLTSGLVALGFGLLWAVGLGDRDFPDVESYPEYLQYLQPGGLAEKVVNALRQKLEVPDDKEVRITNQQWYNNKFRMEVQFVRKGVVKKHERMEETKSGDKTDAEVTTTITETIELAKKCEVETDHKGHVLSLRVQEEEWRPL